MRAADIACCKRCTLRRLCRRSAALRVGAGASAASIASPSCSSTAAAKPMPSHTHPSRGTPRWGWAAAFGWVLRRGASETLMYTVTISVHRPAASTSPAPTTDDGVLWGAASNSGPAARTLQAGARAHSV